MNVRTSRYQAIAFVALALATITPAQAAAPVKEDCRADYQKFCSTVQPGGGRIIDCMKQHTSELSPACAADMHTLAECGPQVKQLCGDAKGAIRDCVKEHANDFTPACRAAFSRQ